MNLIIALSSLLLLALMTQFADMIIIKMSGAKSVILGNTTVWIWDARHINASTAGMFNQQIIFTKAYWNILTESERMAILYHEKGHIIFKHVGKVFVIQSVKTMVFTAIVFCVNPLVFTALLIAFYITTFRMFVPRMKHELQADGYAVGHGYGVSLITALSKFPKNKDLAFRCAKIQAHVIKDR